MQSGIRDLFCVFLRIYLPILPPFRVVAVLMISGFVRKKCGQPIAIRTWVSNNKKKRSITVTNLEKIHLTNKNGKGLLCTKKPEAVASGFLLGDVVVLHQRPAFLLSS